MKDLICGTLCPGTATESLRNHAGILLIAAVSKENIYRLSEGCGVCFIQFDTGSKLSHTLRNAALLSGLRQHNKGNSEI